MFNEMLNLMREFVNDEDNIIDHEYGRCIFCFEEQEFEEVPRLYHKDSCLYQRAKNLIEQYDRTQEKRNV